MKIRISSIPAVLALLFLAFPGASTAADNCPTWFPDFSCERNARPAGFEQPIVAPYLFEEPFITTDLHGTYIWHDFPDSSALGGGSLHVAALQIRVALTDRVAFIATKDGYGWLRPDSPLLDDEGGWFNLTAGLKASIIENRDEGWALSGVLRFEAPTGSDEVFNGHSSGMVLPSLTGAYSLGDLRFVGDFGAQVPFDTDEQSTSLFYHLLASYPIFKEIRAFAQFSGISWIDDGDGSFNVGLEGGARLPLSTVQAVLGTGSFEGADVANIGSESIDGKSMLTWALGVFVPVSEKLTLSTAYERTFGGHKGIFQQRVTTALVYTF